MKDILSFGIGAVLNLIFHDLFLDLLLVPVIYSEHFFLFCSQLLLLQRFIEIKCLKLPTFRIYTQEWDIFSQRGNNLKINIFSMNNCGQKDKQIIQLYICEMSKGCLA